PGDADQRARDGMYDAHSWYDAAARAAHRCVIKPFAIFMATKRAVNTSAQRSAIPAPASSTQPVAAAGRVIWQAGITPMAGPFGTGHFAIAPLTVVFRRPVPRSTMKEGAGRDPRRAVGQP